MNIRRSSTSRAKAQLKKIRSQRGVTQRLVPPRGFSAKRPLANVRQARTKRNLLHPVSTPTTVALATGRGYNGPLCFSRSIGMPEGAGYRRGSPPTLFVRSSTEKKKPPLYLAEEICESVACEINKKLINDGNPTQAVTSLLAL